MMKNIAVCFKQSYYFLFIIGPFQLHFSLMNSKFSPAKAKLLQLKLTLIICLMNFINKKVGNRKN